MQIRLSRNSDGLVWLGHVSQWQTDPGVSNLPFATVNSLGNGFFNWSYQIASGDANNFYATVSDTYTVVLYAFDDTVDVQHSSSSIPVSYVYEVMPPSSTIQSPPQGSYYNVSNNALTLLTGAATDTWKGLGTGISKVLVQIQYYGPDGTSQHRRRFVLERIGRRQRNILDFDSYFQHSDTHLQRHRLGICRSMRQQLVYGRLHPIFGDIPGFRQ